MVWIAYAGDGAVVGRGRRHRHRSLGREYVRTIDLKACGQD
jgi:mannose-6-phosphate isomerase-like protein (cupin superfamily)